MGWIIVLLGASNFEAIAEYEDKDRSQSCLFHQLPPETLMHIFGYLKPRELSRAALVSRGWNDLSQDEALWQALLVQLGFKASEKISSKTLVISALSLNTVNTLIPQLKAPMNEAFVALGYIEARERKTAGLKSGRYGYEKDKKALKAWRKQRCTTPNIVKSKKPPYSIISTGGKVIQKSPRIEFLCQSFNNPTALKQAVILNDELVVKNDRDALYKKYLGHLLGQNGYDQDDKKARQVNEILVGLGDIDAIQRKVFGLVLGDHGYTIDPEFLPRYCALLESGLQAQR